MPTKQLNTGKLFRTFDLDRAAVDTDTRTVPLSFSSEEPYARWFGIEVLDHSPTSVRLERIKRKGPLLVDHDTRDQVGVVEDVQIATDKVGRAVVRFGQSARAQEIYQDVVDGIRANVSVGYMVHRMTLEDPSADSEVYRATDWEPLEISIVSVPADTSVGVGRAESDGSDHTTVIDIPGAHKADPAPPIEEKQPMPEEIKKVEVQDNGPAEQKRAADIVAMGDQHDVPLKDVREYITAGKSVQDFQRHIIELQRQKLQNVSNPTELDLSKKEVQRYSMLRAINAASTGDWSKATFEKECSLAVAEKLGRDAKGFFVPLDVQKRDLTAGGALTGADLVGTDHLGGSFIDALIAESVIGQLGATYLPGLVGNVDIPAMGAATFYWLNGETATVTESTPATRSVALAPKTIGGAVPMSRRFVKQSSPAAEMVVERLLRRGAAAAIDQGVIQGTGLLGQPTGIVAATGVNTVTITTAGQPTFANLVAFETAVAADEALKGRLAYLMAHTVKGHCKTTSIDSGSGIRIWMDNEVNGYTAMASNLMPANGIIFGNFEDVYVGLWGVLDLMVDTSTDAASGGLILRVFQDVDCGLGNAVSFCVPA